MGLFKFITAWRRMIECHTVALMSLYLHSLCDFSLSPALMSSSGCLSLSVSCWMGTGGSGCVARFPSARWGHPWLASASHRNHQLARDDGLVCQGWAVPSIVGLVDVDSPGYVQVLCILASWLISRWQAWHISLTVTFSVISFFQDTEGVPDVRCFIKGW